MAERTGGTQSLFAGAVAGGVSVVAVQPLDVLKTLVIESQRLSGGGNASLHSKSGMMNITKDVIAINGVKGLWRGTGASLARAVPGASLYFSLLEHSKSFLLRRKANRAAAVDGSNDNLSAVESLVVGSFARGTAGVMLHPISVVKTRFEASAALSTTLQFSTPRALASIARNEGLSGLYAGLSPTIVRDVPYSGLFFAAYQQLGNLETLGLPSYAANFARGSVAGIFATVVTHPPDVIKTYMQLYRQHANSSAVGVTLLVLRERGLSALFAGLLPRLLRRPLATATAWMVFEELKK